MKLPSLQTGSAALEWLVAAPIVLLLGLGVLQWGLVFSARSAVELALQTAAREGAQGYASAATISAGLARGLIPFWGIAVSGQPIDAAMPRALTRLAQETASGALSWRQIAPTQESFTDWSQSARDSNGDEIAGVVEIPNDGLKFRAKTVGAASGQTLTDANLLKIELRYGVTLNVPLVAPLAVHIMEQINGCASARAGGTVIGALNLGVPTPAPVPLPWVCRFYRASGPEGQATLRWPVLAITTVRMQTPARRSGLTPARQESPLVLTQASGGKVVPSENSLSTNAPSSNQGATPRAEGASGVSTGSTTSSDSSASIATVAPFTPTAPISPTTATTPSNPGTTQTNAPVPTARQTTGGSESTQGAASPASSGATRSALVDSMLARATAGSSTEAAACTKAGV